MKKFLSLLLSLCLLLGTLPMQVLALPGDIFPSESTVKTVTLNDGSLSLQNEYIHMTFRKLWGSYAYLTVAPAAKPDEESILIGQTPRCSFITYDQGREKIEGVVTEPIKAEFVTKTPNGSANAIKVEYDLTATVSGKTVTGTTTVYYEIAKLSLDGTWGVLTSVDAIKITSADSNGSLGIELETRWGYTLSGFAAMGHRNAADSPALKLSRTVYDHTTKKELSTENSVLTSKVENLDTAQDYPPGGNWCSNYITEVYTDGYNWANPFVGLSEYYKNGTIKAYLPDRVSVTPASRPGDTRVECGDEIGYYFGDRSDYSIVPSHFLWGFRSLTKLTQPIPTNPDKVNISISAKRLAVFSSGSGVTVEHVADDAALSALKKRYGEPVALINGDYESKNGEDFTFTGGAALLSPSVTATWGIDLHYPHRKDGFDGEPFLAYSDSRQIAPYPIPYRCLYSRNIDNLFMAGRDISVTHIALGSVRVMRTGGMMGEVVGMAASICRRHNASPRDVYRLYLPELKRLMSAGTGKAGFPEADTGTSAEAK